MGDGRSMGGRKTREQRLTWLPVSQILSSITSDNPGALPACCLHALIPLIEPVRSGGYSRVWRYKSREGGGQERTDSRNQAQAFTTARRAWRDRVSLAI